MHHPESHLKGGPDLRAGRVSAVTPKPSRSEIGPYPKRGASRWSVASRIVAAVLGGYALAAFCNTALALLIRTPREEAVMLATLPSFLLFAGAVIWAFAASTAGRAWAGILVPTLIAAGATWYLHGGATL